MSVPTRLLAAAREKRLVVFAGAGISMDPPTSLPSWWDVSASAVRAVAARAASIVPDASSLADIVVSRQRSDRFPPDYVAEKIVHSIGGAYFDVLRCIDSDRPNANHLALAELAAARKVPAIVTTNFDRTIEAAFHIRGISCDVRADPASAGALLAHWNAFERGGLPCQILKIHGTADRPDTIIDTLAQRAVKRPAEFVECIRRLLAFGTWGFLGFSGADLETQPNYLGLEAGSGDGRGFTWLVQTRKQPRAGVTRLVNAWRGKAEVIEGTLPDVLLGLLEGATPAPPPTFANTTPPNVDAAAERWSHKLLPSRCALMMADLTYGCAEFARARDTLERLAATYPQHRWNVVSGWSGTTLVLKADDSSGTAHEQPVGFGDPASPMVVALFPQLDAAAADWPTYADALYGLADMVDQLGNAQAAGDIARRSILAGLRAGGRTRIVRGLGILADLQAATQAATAWEEADRLYAHAVNAATDASRIQGNLLVNRARNALRLDRKQDAFVLLEKATKVFATLGDERGRAGVGLVFADLSARVGDFHHAARFWTDVLEFGQRVGDEPMAFEAAMGLGRLHLARNERDEARRAFSTALAAAKALSDPDREQAVRTAMSNAMLAGGN